jgi:hypothetical protein
VILGETGHQDLTNAAGWRYLRSRLTSLLETLPRPHIGVTSLAVGADQLFARQILRSGGELHAVIPFPEYESRFLGDSRARYGRLLSKAAVVVVLPRSGSDEECYLAAGQYIVDHCECLIAIWDGRPARGLGGTADVVAYAHRRSVPLRLIDASPWRT